MEALTDAQGLEDRVNNAVEKLINEIENETTGYIDPYDVIDGVSEESGN